MKDSEMVECTHSLQANFVKVLDMKGIKKAEQPVLIDAYRARYVRV
jgi:hypothetical protein